MSIKVNFDVKFGKNTIELPINQGKAVYNDKSKGLSNLRNKTFTIINRIPSSPENPQIIKWNKFELSNCGKQDGIYDKSTDSAIQRETAWTVYIFNWQEYKEPHWCEDGYYYLPDNEKNKFYTANSGDLIIFGKISEQTPKTEQEFQSLLKKYKNMCGLISSAKAYVNYKSNGTPWRTNHIEAIKE